VTSILTAAPYRHNVPWYTSPEVHTFLAEAGDFLEAAPVDHTALLTEAAYLAARPQPDADQLYGWWRDGDGTVAGAFLRAPRHPPILSTMPDGAVEALASEFPDLPPMGVDGRLVDAVVSAWPGLSERSRIRLYRRGGVDVPVPSWGRARVATPADRDLLVHWYEELMAAHPGDPSDLSYVVDDPIGYGGIVLWEVDCVPRAMAGRSRLVAGMVRLSAIYAPGDAADADAALAAACVAAQAVARDVLIFGSTTSVPHGFEPVLDRVVLAP
jgi:hypothetical protein